MRGWGIATTIVASLTVASCLRNGAFECASADDCRDAGVAGSCETTGFCSFPDDACESGRRYGQHAGNGLGGMCVEDPGTTGDIADTGADDAATLTTTTTTATTTSAGDTMPVVDEDSSAGATSLVDEGGTTTGTTTGDEAQTDPTETTGAGTTTGGMSNCPTFVDDFEDGVIDPAWTQFEAASLLEADGELRMHVTAEDDSAYPGLRLYDVDLQDGWVRAQPGLLPGDQPVRLFLAVGADPEFTDVLYVIAEGTMLMAMREQPGMPFEIYTTMPLDTDAHRWWQIRSEGDQIHFEVSADGVDFEAFESVAAPFELSPAHVVIACTNYEVIPMDMDVSVREFAMCTAG